ncbi:hypothetical protein [Acinetobacter larvae]|uniref:Lipoprotein n=1 Tax=Acinetobacter larvae TaxID=1789224 RepID=A0A1B2M0I3_9GAMM|nr:hypothetical protein [Acinetobacter larvae]AOA58688.1 hypothetical protein BFG52_10200 [Acinetobacter larvae]
MKLQLAMLATLTALLSACAGSYPERVVAKGPLICAVDEVCPELSLGWNEEKRNGFKISTEIKAVEAYDIKQLNFIVDGQTYAYSTIQPTHVSGEAIKTSSNAIYVPVSFLNSFRNAKQIDLNLVTNKGDIDRVVLGADGRQSSAYLTFLKGYLGDLENEK